MNSEAMQKPIADERADDANRRVANETKPVAADNLASQPTGNDPNDQNDKQPLVRQMHAVLSALRPDSRAVSSIAKNWDDTKRLRTQRLSTLHRYPRNS